MIHLKFDEADIPISEQTLKELMAALEEMKTKGLKKCRVSSPYSKTVFIISSDENNTSIQYSLNNREHNDHA